ncbi:hypothetical protein [Bradyrhizobium sp.]|uniref:hypothetical protein n=1 Tax=Bradyrhizobium sp. TaxID=376 RepID=UPI0039E5CA6B
MKVGKAFELSVTSVDSTPAAEKSESKELRQRRSLAVGQEFDIENVELSEAITRSRIVWVVFGTIAAFLMGSAALGLYKGEFSALQAVWSATAPVYGAIAGYFFSRQGDNKSRRKR